MIELISIIASAAICILTPIEVNKIRAGWVRKNFKGTREQFTAAYRKQLTIILYVGLVFAVLNIGLGIVETKPGENIVKFVAAALWLAVSVICFIYRGKLTAPSPPPGERAG